MRRYALIFLVTFLWASFTSIISDGKFSFLAVALTLTLLLALSIFLPLGLAITVVLVVGFVTDILSPAGYGSTSAAFIVSVLIIPQLLAPIVRKPTPRFILCAIIAPMIYVTTAWATNSIINWFYSEPLILLDTNIFIGGARAMLAGGIFALTGILLWSRAAGIFQRRFLFSSRSI